MPGLTTRKGNQWRTRIDYQWRTRYATTITQLIAVSAPLFPYIVVMFQIQVQSTESVVQEHIRQTILCIQAQHAKSKAMSESRI
jgi:hypothetical protein